MRGIALELSATICTIAPLSAAPVRLSRTVPETVTPCPLATLQSRATATREVRTDRSRSGLPENPAEDFRKSLARVVEHHDDEQQGNRGEAEAKNVFACLEAERASLGRLDDVQEDLPPVESAKGQQIEHRDIDAQQRNQVEEILEAT